MLAELITRLIIGAFACSAISVTIARSRAAKPLRQWVEQQGKTLGHLINCPYCISHWCAIFFGLTYIPWTGSVHAVIAHIFAMVGLSMLVTGLGMEWLHMSEKRIEELEDERDELHVQNVNLRLTLEKIADIAETD